MTTATETRAVRFDPHAPYFIGAVVHMACDYVRVKEGGEHILFGKGEVTHPADRKQCYLVAVHPPEGRSVTYTVLGDFPETFQAGEGLELELQQGDVANVTVLPPRIQSGEPTGRAA